MGASYSQSLTSKPILTKAATSGILYTLQELIAAAATSTPADSSKALWMSAYGFLISGPLGHFLYSSMESIFYGVEGGAKAGLSKLIFSNFIITPIQNSSYLIALALISGANMVKAIKITKAKIFGLMKISWLVSPIAQIFAFRNLKPKFNMTFFNLVAFVFGTLINIKAKLDSKKKASDANGKGKKL